MKSIYITGASGVLGSELAGHFMGRPGYRVHTVARRPCPRVPGDHPGQRIVGQIFDAAWLDPVDTAATVVHCAGLSDPRAVFRSFAALSREHILPHVEMVEAMLARGWRGRLIFFSSGGAIYGETTALPIRETHPTNPKSFYGLHKLCLEQAYIHLAQTYGFELVILRVANPYGSLMAKPTQGVIPILIDAFLTGRTFQIIGDGSAERDYVEMSDLCRAVELSVEADLGGNPTILNIGSGTGVALSTLIGVLRGILRRPLNTVRVPAHHDVQSNVLCSDRAMALLGWKAKIPLKTGLQKLVEQLHVHHNQP